MLLLTANRGANYGLISLLRQEEEVFPDLHTEILNICIKLAFLVKTAALSGQLQRVAAELHYSKAECLQLT